ncbi:MAG: hypothetical protein CME65_02550 [Halobacteriovoraceae bacterium]|nr:hypothetical protein [Halobacteriovoraceae bacterium]|tara:strand:- start:3749 stop:4465 length:717 start_codon:yes stop_codon:yes gene_type:complete
MNLKVVGLIFFGILPIVVLTIFSGPIGQDQLYHQFADQNQYFGIPNFWNVISNIPFLLVFGYGLWEFKRSSQSLSWIVFLIGIALVGPGSAYYHWDPRDASLVWDRLPMTIGFMGLTSFILTQVFQLRWEKQLVLILLLLGVYSILHWINYDDLRIYAWVQFAPIVLVIYCAIFFPSPILKPGLLMGAVGFYSLAKIVEHSDKEIFQITEVMSGHALKHPLAAVAVLFLIQTNRLEKL